MSVVTKELLLEHEMRNYIRTVKARVESATGASCVNIAYDNSKGDGTWSINSWGGGAKNDITTKGAVLYAVEQEHLRRCGVEQALSVLPAMIAYMPNAPIDSSTDGANTED